MTLMDFGIKRHSIWVFTVFQNALLQNEKGYCYKCLFTSYDLLSVIVAFPRPKIICFMTTIVTRGYSDNKHARIQEFLPVGRGGVQARLPENSSVNVLCLVLNLFYSFTLGYQ